MKREKKEKEPSLENFCAQNRRKNRTHTAQIQKFVWNVCYWKPDQTNSKYDEIWWQHTSRCLQTPQIGNTQIRGLVWSQFKNSSKHPIWTVFVTFGLNTCASFFPQLHWLHNKAHKKLDSKWINVKKRNNEKDSKMKDEKIKYRRQKNSIILYFCKNTRNGSFKKPIKRM